MLSIIVAKAENNVIGKNNELIWHIPEDLKRFKELTTGHVIIMGRKTFESLGRVLPNRKHVILTQNRNYKIEESNVEIVYSVEELKKYIDNDEENFVIGGGMIYQLLLPFTQKMYITEIHKNYDGDTTFPEFSALEWSETERIKSKDYDFVTYLRKDEKI